ncbi:polyprenyl synthetase [Halobacterium hubeiense]|uniref:polyprenyl synthetase n=1 Tax=Halobacterium hubeiense TaxID=1407499 RepID=UPI003C71CB6A
MTELSPAARRAALDRRLDAVLTADAGGLSLARATVLDAPDRWFGQLVALSHDAVADAPEPDAVLPAATAVELLRGYCRLRNDLLAEGRADDQTAALLASDYLNSAAYAALGRVDGGPPADSFAALTDVLQSVVEGFDAAYGDAPADYRSLLDDTVGALGAGAAVLGATLADASDGRREQFELVGRGFSAARYVQYTLNSRRDALLPEGVDDGDLRGYGADRLREAREALDRLAATADVDSMQGFLAERSPQTLRP